MSDSKLNFTSLKISVGSRVQFYFSGQTNGNKHFKIQGQTDEPLNETGLAQAELVGQALKDIEFNQAFSSDLSRAKVTCQKIIEANEASVTIQETELIREKSFGQAENMHYVQFAYLTMIRNQTLPLNYVPTDGECKDDLRQRAKLFIQDMLCKNVANFSTNPQQILIVSHGEFLTHFFYVLSHDFQCSFTTNERDVMSKRPPNTSWCQVEVILSNSEIQNVNCIQTWNVEHLKALKSTVCNIL